MNLSTANIVALHLVATLALTGCASQVYKTQVVQPQEKAQNQRLQRVEIYITDSPRYSARNDYNESMAEFSQILQEKIAAEFPTAKVALAMTLAPTEPGLRLSLTVQDFRYVSATARFLTGVMVGNARLRVKVELLDLQTKASNGEATFGTSSSWVEGVMGGTTSRQIEAVADSIVGFLQERLGRATS